MYKIIIIRLRSNIFWKKKNTQEMKRIPSVYFWDNHNIGAGIISLKKSLNYFFSFY